MTDETEPARYFADISRELVAVPSVGAVLEVLVHAAVEVVGCDHVSISHRKGRALVSAASDDDVGPLLDAAQTDRDEGPCLDAIRLGQPMVSADLANDPRWPAYGPRAFEVAGIRSSYASDLRDAGGRILGALNLFDTRLGFFGSDPQQEARIAILATHTAAALHASLEREQLRAALESRDLIGQAKGILMTRSGVDASSAFDLLVAESQRTNVKLHEVARRLIDRQVHEGPPSP